MRLHDFSALGFDCHGTLIDWEACEAFGASIALWPAFSDSAAALGLARCWIDRHSSEGGAMPGPEGAPPPDFHFANLAEFAAAYREEGR